jgi:hypothetical protein
MEVECQAEFTEASLDLAMQGNEVATTNAQGMFPADNADARR